MLENPLGFYNLGPSPLPASLWISSKVQFTIKRPMSLHPWTAREGERVPQTVAVSGARNIRRDRMSGGSPGEERERRRGLGAGLAPGSAATPAPIPSLPSRVPHPTPADIKVRRSALHPPPPPDTREIQLHLETQCLPLLD